MSNTDVNGVNTKFTTTFRHTRALPGVQGIPAITWVFELDSKSDMIRFAFSVCSSRDNFSREIGRNLAVARLNEASWYKTKRDPDKSLVGAAIAHLQQRFDTLEQGTEKTLIGNCLYAATYVEQVNSIIDSLTEADEEDDDNQSTYGCGGCDTKHCCNGC